MLDNILHDWQEKALHEKLLKCSSPTTTTTTTTNNENHNTIQPSNDSQQQSIMAINEVSLYFGFFGEI